MGIKAAAVRPADNIPQHSTGTGRLSKWLLGGPSLSLSLPLVLSRFPRAFLPSFLPRLHGSRYALVSFV